MKTDLIDRTIARHPQADWTLKKIFQHFCFDQIWTIVIIRDKTFGKGFEIEIKD